MISLQEPLLHKGYTFSSSPILADCSRLGRTLLSVATKRIQIIGSHPHHIGSSIKTARRAEQPDLEPLLDCKQEQLVLSRSWVLGAGARRKRNAFRKHPRQHGCCASLSYASLPHLAMSAICAIHALWKLQTPATLYKQCQVTFNLCCSTEAGCVMDNVVNLLSYKPCTRSRFIRAGNRSNRGDADDVLKNQMMAQGEERASVQTAVQSEYCSTRHGAWGPITRQTS